MTGPHPPPLLPPGPRIRKGVLAEEFWISNLARAEDPFFEHAIPALMLQATACTHLARGLAYTLRLCKI